MQIAGKKAHSQVTCVNCSLLVKTSKINCFYAAITSPRRQAKWLQPHVNLLEYNAYFAGSFTCGTHAKVHATSKQKCLLLQAKIHQFADKIIEIAVKKPAIAHKFTCNSGNLLSHREKKSFANCRLVNMHPSGTVARNLHALLHGIACILREVLVA